MLGNVAAEVRDPSLVAVPDAEHRWSRADEFFGALTGAEGLCQVLDLGCGTGRLTVALANAGHVVAGADPARASLALARAKGGGRASEWSEGTSSSVARSGFDSRS
jgi:2-polyprenyl-3-methyl-5-hydroxy-6-metoxy-1,4-benzoquinol methylase